MVKTLSTRLFTVLAAIGMAGALGACGDNLHPGGDDGGDDGVVPDSNTGAPDSEIDGPAPTATVSSTIAVTDVKVTDPAAAAVNGIYGGSISISFSALTMNGGEPVPPFTNPVGGCALTHFDATHTPNPLLDSGGVSITGDGLLKTVGGCGFSAAFGGYACVSNQAAGATMAARDGHTAAGNDNVAIYTLPGVNFGMAPAVNISTIARAATGVVTVVTSTPNGFSTGTFVTIAGVADSSFNSPVPGPGFPVNVIDSTTFVYQEPSALGVAADSTGTAAQPTQKIVTSVLNVNGFTNAAFNSGFSAFPIILQLSADTVLVANPAPANDVNETAVTAVNYAVLNGFTPTPSASLTLGPILGNFLGPKSTSVTIQKAADSVWPAIDQTVYARGDGLTLATASTTPQGFPYTDPAAAVTYSCSGAGGDCGSHCDVGDADCTQPALEAIIVSGRATKKDVSALFPFSMPTEVPGTDEWLEWQCSAPLGTSITLPAAMVQDIVDFAPTRVETRVIVAAGALLDDGGLNSMKLLVGHGLVGHSDNPAN